MLHRLESEHATGNFRQAAPTGQLYRMVHPNRVIECRVVDVQGEDHAFVTDRAPVRRVHC